MLVGGLEDIGDWEVKLTDESKQENAAELNSRSHHCDRDGKKMKIWLWRASYYFNARQER